MYDPVAFRIEEVEHWLRGAGFALVETRRVLRNKRLTLEEAERELYAEVEGRYALIPDAEIEEGVRRMRGRGRDRVDRPAADVSTHRKELAVPRNRLPSAAKSK